MKGSIKISMIFVLIILFISIKSNVFSENKIIDVPMDYQVYINQLEEKNKLFKEAIDNFGATSKEEAVRLYSQGVKERSGPLQYSVMCRNLKNEFTKKMIDEENYAWVTGTSSPWVSGYKVVDTKKNNKDRYTITVKFTLNDAKGPMAEDIRELVVQEIDEVWCIIQIKENIKTGH